jgi:hypothetical protein
MDDAALVRVRRDGRHRVQQQRMVRHDQVRPDRKGLIDRLGYAVDDAQHLLDRAVEVTEDEADPVPLFGPASGIAQIEGVDDVAHGGQRRSGAGRVGHGRQLYR